jgi:hypothetical protein
MGGKRRVVASPRHKYSAWFGIVSTHMKRTTANEEEADGQQLNHREVRDLEIVFTPAPSIRNRQLAVQHFSGLISGFRDRSLLSTSNA